MAKPKKKSCGPERLFNPKSVAILGASAEPGKIGFKVVNNLKITEHLRPPVPIFAALGNPVEVTGQTKKSNYPQIIGAMADQPDVDSIVGVCIGQDIPEFGNELIAVHHKTPVVCCCVAPKLEQILKDANIPNYHSVDRAVKVMRHMAQRGAKFAR